MHLIQIPDNSFLGSHTLNIPALSCSPHPPTYTHRTASCGGIWDLAWLLQTISHWDTAYKPVGGGSYFFPFPWCMAELTGEIGFVSLQCSHTDQHSFFWLTDKRYTVQKSKLRDTQSKNPNFVEASKSPGTIEPSRMRLKVLALHGTLISQGGLPQQGRA